ncbi:hypothetical protein M8J76_000174 [Diaphorina citri]|nr:hypothetical protein M8J76_000174 [Diaphorina citri]
MASFFGTAFNPFASPVGSKIEMATDPTLASENWALNMEICDIINETEDGPKDAIKAIRKRLQQYAGKDYTVIMYTLTVLETCVKNCNRRFHILVCSKDFIQELYKLIGPKNEPPIIVQDKVLSLIQSWADAFKDIPNLEGVNQIYQELRSKGIEFPMTDLDAMAPIITPKKSKEVASSHPVQRSKVPMGAAGDHDERLTPEQVTKLHKDLEVVQANMAVFNEMLNTLIPGQEHSSDIELITELHATCKAMQERIVQLISKYSQEDFITELLQVNDQLNNLFLRFNRYESNREAAIGKQNPDAASKLSKKPDVAADSGPSLIDLDDDDPVDVGLNSNLSKLNISQPPAKTSPSSQVEDSEFDMFAQSRNVTYEGSKKSGSSYEDNLKPAQMSGLGEFNKAKATPPPSLTGDPILGTHKESDFDEMAAWLGEGASGNNTSRSGATAEESLTSSEFERFLAERAVAADTPPSQSGDAGSQPNRKAKQEAPVFGMELSRQ